MCCGGITRSGSLLACWFMSRNAGNICAHSWPGRDSCPCWDRSVVRPRPVRFISWRGLWVRVYLSPRKLAIYTEAEIFGQARRKRVRFSSEGVKLTAFSDLKPGDYVVHINHGIGRYAYQDPAGSPVFTGITWSGLCLVMTVCCPRGQINCSKICGVEDEPPKVRSWAAGIGSR